MTQNGRYHGALVVRGHQDDMLDRFSRIAAATLEDYGHPVERNSMFSPRTARITASHYVVKLNLAQGVTMGEHGPAGALIDAIGHIGGHHHADKHWRLQIEMYAADPARDDSDISELLLVVMLYRMCGEYDTRMVEWLDALTILTPEQFLEAFGNISPSLVKSRLTDSDIDDPRFAPVDESARYAGKPPDEAAPIGHALSFRAFPELAEPESEGPEYNDVQRLSAWGMTGMMMFLSAPVALSMAGVNLLRGEDFRLNTHVLAFTCLLVTLEGSGMLGSLVARLPI